MSAEESGDASSYPLTRSASHGLFLEFLCQPQTQDFLKEIFRRAKEGTLDERRFLRQKDGSRAPSVPSPPSSPKSTGALSQYSIGKEISTSSIGGLGMSNPPRSPVRRPEPRSLLAGRMSGEGESFGEWPTSASDEAGRVGVPFSTLAADARSSPPSHSAATGSSLLPVTPTRDAIGRETSDTTRLSPGAGASSTAGATSSASPGAPGKDAMEGVGRSPHLALPPGADGESGALSALPFAGVGVPGPGSSPSSDAAAADSEADAAGRREGGGGSPAGGGSPSQQNIQIPGLTSRKSGSPKSGTSPAGSSHSPSAVGPSVMPSSSPLFTASLSPTARKRAEASPRSPRETAKLLHTPGAAAGGSPEERASSIASATTPSFPMRDGGAAARAPGPLRPSEMPEELKARLREEGKNIPKNVLLHGLGPPRCNITAEVSAALDLAFSGHGVEMDKETFASKIVVDLLGLSKYMAGPFFRKLSGGDNVVTRTRLESFWEGRLCLTDANLNFLNVTKADNKSFVDRIVMRPFIRELLDFHPGLDFLRETPEFQERYADTVVARIFFVCDKRSVGKITYKDLKKTNLVSTWNSLDTETDINKVRDFFSYEHFYVLYCKFWELDVDHDFLLDREDLLKYDGHAFGRKVIDRIFSEVPMRFSSANQGKMGYEDFIWFLMMDEDKSSDRAIDFWFRLVDLDGDGWIRDHEMVFFYEETQRRLECLTHEVVPFDDILCQMSDMINPEVTAQFRLRDFKRNRKNSGVFFSVLLSLNKYLAYENRDPFMQKQEQLEFPDFSDWDRFCATEYVRLAMEDEGEEAG